MVWTITFFIGSIFWMRSNAFILNDTPYKESTTICKRYDAIVIFILFFCYPNFNLFRSFFLLFILFYIVKSIAMVIFCIQFKWQEFSMIQNHLLIWSSNNHLNKQLFCLKSLWHSTVINHQKKMFGNLSA